MRSMIFEKYASVEKPWIISDSIINYFEVDKNTAKEDAKKWWELEGDFKPSNTGRADNMLDAQTFQNWKNYAILEAGREKAA